MARGPLDVEGEPLRRPYREHAEQREGREKRGIEKSAVWHEKNNFVQSERISKQRFSLGFSYFHVPAYSSKYRSQTARDGHSMLYHVAWLVGG